MLKDLDLNRPALMNFISNTFDVDKIVTGVEADLAELYNKVHRRRHLIFEAQKNINNKIDVEKNKAFLKKVIPKENNYPSERRIIIKRSIMNQFTGIAHTILQELLKDG